jgi:hypothetical protein
MAKGETIMPVPQGDITTTEILVPEVASLDEALIAADAEEVDDSSTEQG